MRLSKISCLSILVLTSSALAAPAPIENAETSMEDSNALEKRFGAIFILLVKVIGGQLLAGAAKVAVDVAKAHLEPEGSKFKDFNAARTAFTQKIVKELYDNRYPRNVKGVSCFNGPYSFSRGARYEGPINIKFEWDMYNTDYDCFEIISGSVQNRGDGGFINTANYGTCRFHDKTYTC